MTVFSLVLLYWVVTGLTMAIYDVSDKTEVWALQGGGPGAGLTSQANESFPLPEPATLADGIASSLAQVQGMQVASVDFRMVGAHALLQMAKSDGDRATRRRFFAATGAPMPDIVADGDATAPRPPNVVRHDNLKMWHRGNIAGLFGQAVGICAGLSLAVLSVTGLCLYVKLWNVRRRNGHPAPLWRSPGAFWRQMHRWVAVLSAAFILNISLSGTVLAVSEFLLHLWRDHHIGSPPYPRAPTPMPPISAAPLPPAIMAMLETSYRAAHQESPNAPISAVTLVERGDGMAKGLVTLGGADRRIFAYDATTGARTTDWATDGVQHGNGYFADWHQVLKRIHRGDIIGHFQGRYIDMTAGACLLYLVVSSFVMYSELLTRRLRAGRRALFWK